MNTGKELLLDNNRVAIQAPTSFECDIITLTGSNQEIDVSNKRIASVSITNSSTSDITFSHDGVTFVTLVSEASISLPVLLMNTIYINGTASDTVQVIFTFLR